MSGANIVDVPINKIDPNPFRNLGVYPYIERKVAALVRSYAEVGMWPGGVIAREVGERYELAFGHHRVEAARRSKLPTVAVTVMALNNEQMMGYMGRENLEDYNAEFLVMLTAWEAAVEFARTSWQKSQPTDIAKLLGWTINKRRDYAELNDTAAACSSALELITAGHITREVLDGLTVVAAREICGEARRTIKQVADVGKMTGATATSIADAQKQVGKAVTLTAEQNRKGQVARKDLRGTVAVHTYRFAKEARKEANMPLFAGFAKTVAKQISHWNNDDTVRDRLVEMIAALPKLVMVEDIQAVDRVLFELEHATKRIDGSIKKLTAKPAAVVKLRAVAGDKS